jgi:hypothetical protein
MHKILSSIILKRDKYTMKLTTVLDALNQQKNRMALLAACFLHVLLFKPEDGGMALKPRFSS